MSDYFQGQLCIVDLREVAAVTMRESDTVTVPYRIVITLKNAITISVVDDEARAFLEAYRKWIEREVRGRCQHEWAATMDGWNICRICGMRPSGVKPI